MINLLRTAVWNGGGAVEDDNKCKLSAMALCLELETPLSNELAKLSEIDVKNSPLLSIVLFCQTSFPSSVSINQGAAES